jgi:hypothetical protein
MEVFYTIAYALVLVICLVLVWQGASDLWHR